MFSHVLIEKGQNWYAELLRLSLSESNDLQINPRNCIGTVLALNGHRKYFCMYHAKHPESNRGAKVGLNCFCFFLSALHLYEHNTQSSFSDSSKWHGTLVLHHRIQRQVPSLEWTVIRMDRRESVKVTHRFYWRKICWTVWATG